MDSSRAPPLGLYVHLPWCIRKCPYCDFNSFEASGTLDETRYIDALLRDLDAELSLVSERTLTTIFIGGGTPSLFSGRSIDTLLDGIRQRLPTGDDLEITLEANPGAAEAARFSDYRRSGVNRLSIGVQSFRNPQLRALGRVHSVADAEAAVAAARQAGFDNINIDLMYGLPGDTIETSLADLGRAIELAPSHLSWYQLTLEPNTAFERRPPPLPDEAVIDAIERRGRELLASHGFERYEVSAYARPGSRCRHNLNYWRFGDYIGIGAGAHGKLTLQDSPGIQRRSRTRNPRSYVERAGSTAAFTTEGIVAADDLITEFLMNALRLVDGFETELLPARTGQPLQMIAAGVETARERGWLDVSEARISVTEDGMRSLNRLLTLF